MTTDQAEVQRFRDDRHLEARRGFFLSVRPSLSGMLANINVCHSAFYVPMALGDLIGWLRANPNVHDTKIPSILKGLRVSSVHISNVWTIWGYASPHDGQRYMLHPPKLARNSVRGAGPNDVKFFLEPARPKSATLETESSTHRAKVKDREEKINSHNWPGCNCPGQALTIAEHFQSSMYSCLRIPS